MKSRFLSSVAKKGFSAKNIVVIIFGAIVLISLFRTGYSFFEMKSVRDSLNEEITRDRKSVVRERVFKDV